VSTQPSISYEPVLREPFTYIALGPLTNLAHMMRQDSKLVRERIGRIICMGGALDVSGNTSPVAECQCSMSMLLALLNNIRYQSTSLQTLLPVKELLLSDSGLST